MGIMDYVPIGKAISEIVSATATWKATGSSVAMKGALARLNTLIAKWNLKVVAVPVSGKMDGVHPWEALRPPAGTLVFVVMERGGV